MLDNKKGIGDNRLDRQTDRQTDRNFIKYNSSCL